MWSSRSQDLRVKYGSGSENTGSLMRNLIVYVCLFLVLLQCSVSRAESLQRRRSITLKTFASICPSSSQQSWQLDGVSAEELVLEVTSPLRGQLLKRTDCITPIWGALNMFVMFFSNHIYYLFKVNSSTILYYQTIKVEYKCLWCLMCFFPFLVRMSWMTFFVLLSWRNYWLKVIIIYISWLSFFTLFSIKV